MSVLLDCVVSGFRYPRGWLTRAGVMDFCTLGLSPNLNSTNVYMLCTSRGSWHRQMHYSICTSVCMSTIHEV
jgi:hypothetical protein